MSLFKLAISAGAIEKGFQAVKDFAHGAAEKAAGGAKKTVIPKMKYTQPTQTMGLKARTWAFHNPIKATTGLVAGGAAVDHVVTK